MSRNTMHELFRPGEILPDRRTNEAEGRLVKEGELESHRADAAAEE
jgi:hypothetical protein